MVPFVEKDSTALKFISALPVGSVPLYLVLNSSLGFTQLNILIFYRNLTFLSLVSGLLKWLLVRWRTDDR